MACLSTLAEFTEDVDSIPYGNVGTPLSSLTQLSNLSLPMVELRKVLDARHASENEDLLIRKPAFSQERPNASQVQDSQLSIESGRDGVDTVEGIQQTVNEELRQCDTETIDPEPKTSPTASSFVYTPVSPLWS